MRLLQFNHSDPNLRFRPIHLDVLTCLDKIRSVRMQIKMYDAIRELA